MKLKLHLLLCLLVAVFASHAQSFECRVENESFPSASTYEFDIKLYATGTTSSWEYGIGTYYLNMNSAFRNAGSITVSIVAGTSDLNPAQIPTSVTYNTANNYIAVAAKTPPGSGFGTLINHDGIRVLRVRLSNSVPFSNTAAPNLTWRWATPNSLVSTYMGGVLIPIANNTNTSGQKFCKTPNYWNGSSWNKGLPTDTTDAVIFSGTYLGSLSVLSLAIAPNGTLNLTDTCTFQYQKSFNNYGVLNYSINSQSGINGSTSPNGMFFSQVGSNQRIVFNPNIGYLVDSVVVNGVKVDSTNGYTFYNLNEPQNLKVTFKPLPVYTLSINTGKGGTTNPSTLLTASQGSSKQIVFMPDADFEVESVMVNGIKVDSTISYTFNNITANQSISVTFQAIPGLQVRVTGNNNTFPAMASSYSTLASAVSALNAVTSFTGPVQIKCNNITETAPIGGYVINFAGITTAANNVVIDGAGSVITAPILTTAGVRNDAIMCLVGVDYVTLQNFTLNENSANTTGGAVASQKLTEFGIALFAKSATDGAQYNTIQYNTINLSNASVRYQNAIGVFSTSATSQNNGALATTSVSGTNSFNKFYGNTITGVAQGFYFISPAQTATVFESGNEVGSAVASSGNTITFGYANTIGDLGFTLYDGTLPAGIYFRNVVGNSAINNSIANNSGLTLACAGIYSGNSIAPTGIPVTTTNFSNNTITLTQSASVAMTGIEYAAGVSTTAIICKNNTISINRTCVLANSAAINGINAGYNAAASDVSNNTVSIVDYFLPTATLSNSGAIYGIRIPGATYDKTDVYGNTLTINRKLNASATSTTTHSGLVYAYYMGNACQTLNMGDTAIGRGNKLIIWDDISGAGYNFVSGTHYLFYTPASHGTFNFQGNSVSMGANGNKLALTGALYVLYHPATITTKLLIDKNTFNIDRSAGYTGSTYGFYAYGSTPVLAGGYTISNNTMNLLGPNGNTPSTGAGLYYGIYNYDGIALQTLKNFSNNSFTGIGAFSSVYGIYSLMGNININNNNFNIISNYKRGYISMYGIYSAGYTTSTNNINIYNNTIEQLTHTDSAYYTVNIYGIYHSGGVLANIYNNTVKKISTGFNIKISTPGTYFANVTGIQIAGGTTINVYRNNLYNITTSHDDINSNASGIKITGGTVANLYNNLINISTPIANMNNRFASLAGFYINCNVAATNHNIYNNTVYLNTTSTGANFGTAAVYHVANATATVSNLILNNNIFYNNCIPTGSGGAYGMRRSYLATSGLNNYNASSSNNFWFGYSGMYYDSAAMLSLADFKSYGSPREAGSITEPLTFLNTSNPSLANYMHLDPNFYSQTESGGIAIAGNSTDDYQTNGIRMGYPKPAQLYGGGTAPDIGAFEDDLAQSDLTGPSILYTPIANTTDLNPVTLNVSIKDASGVPISGLGMPVLYYKLQSATSYNSVKGVAQGNNVYSFTFGGGNVGDAISYYVVAQDNLGNLSAMPSAGVGAMSATPPKAATPPTLTSSYFILNTLAGNIRIGGTFKGPSVGCNYVSLNEALLDFIPGQVRSVYVLNGGSGYTSAPTVTISGGGGSGALAVAEIDSASGSVTKIIVTRTGSGYASTPNITLSHPSGTSAVVQLNLSAGKIVNAPTAFILTNTYNSITENVFPIVIPEIRGVNASNTITIKPDAGATPVIRGNSATSIIQLYSADHITIDGSNSGSNSQDLSIANTNSGLSTAVIQLVSVSTGLGANAVTNGSRNNTIQNLIITNGISTGVNYGIAVGSSIGVGGADNDSNAIINNNFNGSARAIYVNGTDSVSQFGLDNITIAKNSINYSGTASSFDAIYIGNALNSNISSNNFDLITSGYTPVCINLGTGANNVLVERNYINRCHCTSTYGYGAHGIKVGTGLKWSNITISNNVINNVNGTNYLMYYGSSSVGIYIGTSTTGKVNVYHNTVNMYGDYISNGYNAACLTTAFLATAYSSELDVRNNIFSNTLRNPYISTSAASSKNYAMHSDAAPSVFTQLNNNMYYVAPTVQGRLAYIALPTPKTDTTLAMLQTDFGQNNASIFEDPMFNSTSILKPKPNSLALGSGVPLAMVNSDFLGTTRSSMTPTLGAYEDTSRVFVNITCSAGSNGQIDPTGVSILRIWKSKKVTMTPNFGYQVDSVIVNGIKVDSTLSYTFTNVTSDQTIRVTFKLIEVNILSVAGPNGSINPVGSSKLLFGNAINYVITPAAGYRIDSVIVNNVLTDSTLSYTFKNVVSNQSIRVTFIKTYQIYSSSDLNGSISELGYNLVDSADSKTYSFTPNSGYWIDSVIVNGVQVPTASSYTFSNVLSNQTIRVTYRSLAAALAAANICANDTLVSTVNPPAQSNVRATTYYSNIYLFNQNNTSNAYKYNVNERKYTAIANKPTACIECGVAEANGKVYCFNTNGTTEAYDIATNTWQNQMNQPSGSSSSVYAASINNKIYVLGYFNNQNTFHQFNPQTNSYTTINRPVTSSIQSRLVAFNNKLYKIGGTDNNNQPISSVEVYNPSNYSWTAMPDLPEALSQVGATYYDNKLYVFGGKQSNNTNSNKVYVFDFTSNAWYAESNTQNTINKANIEAKTANGLVYLFGGTDNTNTETNQALRYFCKDQLCSCKWAEYICNGESSDNPCTSNSSYRPGTVFCNGTPTTVVDVTNPITGKTWMDRNLGATRAATSSSDAAAYGDLYQWGRGADGHQCRNSDTLRVLSTTDQPGHGKFILLSNVTEDWRSTQSNYLWQGESGINNPCPIGYRLPTYYELDAERLTWSQNSSLGAFASPIKFPNSGFRDQNNGQIYDSGYTAYYWSSSLSNTYAWNLLIFDNGAYLFDFSKPFGYSVRCIKN